MEDAGATRDEIVPQHWDFSQNNSENSRKQNSQKSKFDLELNSTMSIETLYEWAILYAKSLKPVFTWYLVTHDRLSGWIETDLKRVQRS